jgi:hemoglobin
MHDIENREDVSRLVDNFYKKVIHDKVIGHFFTVVADFSWEVHIPIMVNFWDTILFGNMGYKGNPMLKHIALHKLSEMKHEHFERWLELWKETVHENFEGEKATEAITRATSIAQLMEYKVNSIFS